MAIAIFTFFFTFFFKFSFALAFCDSQGTMAIAKFSSKYIYMIFNLRKIIHFNIIKFFYNLI